MSISFAPRWFPTKVREGPSGDVTIVERSCVPFEIRRVYFLTGTAPGSSRGAHAHKTLEQFFVPITGSCILDVKSASGDRETFHLNRRDLGLYLPPGYWRTVHDFAQHHVLAVFASQEYDESDYIRDFDEYQSWSASR